MTAPLVPADRPGLTRTEAEGLLAGAGVSIAGPALLARRGYFRDTMGAPGVNDIGLYDDAIFLLAPGVFTGFNANVDPSRQRPGMATLAAGVWTYELGIHGLSKPFEARYPALVQAAPVTVTRWRPGGLPPLTDTGLFGINIHRGGHTTTSSEGCQTIHPAQWQEFFAAVAKAILAARVRTIPYVLTARGPTDPR